MISNRSIPFFAFALFSVAVIVYFSTAPPAQAPVQEQDAPRTATAEPLTLTVDDGSDAPQAFTGIPHVTGMTALGILEQVAVRQGIQVNIKDYGDLGMLVTQIGDAKNGDNSRYWMYRVNGTLPMVAADRYVLDAGDAVIWSFAEEK